MESFYGRNQGKIDTITAVTTLAFDRRRSNFYRKQLFAALKILDDGLVPSGQLIGSWGGAVGMTQMIPTTFIESAYDWDGGGIDIWNSFADAFASTANYLTSIDKNPWSIDSTWGREVLPPKNIKSFYSSLEQENPKGCRAVKRRSIPKSLPEWSELGFKTIQNTTLPQRSDLEARLVAPDGIEGRMFLVYPSGITPSGGELFLPLFYENLETLFDYCKNSQILIQNDIIELFDERTENLQDYFEARNDSKDSFFLFSIVASSSAIIEKVFLFSDLKHE